MKKVMIAVTAGLVGLMAINTAQALTINGGNGPHTFTGTADLSKGSLTLRNCTLTLTGTVEEAAGNMVINVTSGSASGAGLCSSVKLNFPWTASVPVSSIPTTSNATVNGTFTNVDVGTPLGKCTSSPGSIGAVFGPINGANGGSYFTFNSSLGTCTVNGRVDNSTVSVTNP